jgi:polysaccharide export outer membrane protein
MPSLPRFFTGIFHSLVALFLGFTLLSALLIGASAMAQDQPVKPADNPAPEVFPSAKPASPAPENPKTAEKPDVSKTTDKPSEEDSGSGLRLGAGDLLEVTVYNVPELGTKSRIGNSGDVYLPLIDYVHLAGLTIEEAQALIEKRLSDGGFVKSPHVTLFVNEYTSQGANILGEVAKPGVYPVLGEPRLVDMVSAAGGYTEKAGKSITISHRNQEDKPVTVPLKRNSADNPANRMTVSPGDTILVHKADVVYVVGDVARPSGFLMDAENLTVLKVIALAGGTNRTAKLNGARIIRKGPSGMTETPIELKKMLAAKAPDLTMQGDDILFVPSSLSKVVLGRTVDVAQQAANAATILAIN